MAAIHGVFLAFLNAGDHAVISDVAYGGTYRLCTKVFARFGVEFTFADTSDPEDVKKSMRDETRLILTETPANPTLKLTDIAAVSAIAKEHGVPHAIDNTFLTPYYQRPIELGADLVVHSTTKYLDGHNATVGGAVVSATDELHEKVAFVQNATGTIMSPQVAWLTLQGCKTLTVRMDGQSANAMAIAKFLEAHPKVGTVRYPGLPSHPQHELATRQASGYGAMVWFEVEGGLAAGKAIMDSLELWTLAEKPRLGRVSRHPSGHDDPCRCRGSRAQARRDHGRSGAAFRRSRRCAGLDRRPRQGARESVRRANGFIRCARFASCCLRRPSRSARLLP